MTTLSPTHAAILRSERRYYQSRAIPVGAGLAVVLLCLWYAGFFNLEGYIHGVPNLWRILLAEGIPPDFRRYAEWGKPLLDTLVMSIAGTAIAVFLSFGLAFLAARNTSPHPVIYLLTRGLLNVLRAIPELVLGIIFVMTVKLGLLPGVWALGLHSVGMVGKFFAEAVEHVDGAALEAIAATGATRLQVLWHGVLPQVWPRMADVAFYRWEYNFRASTVMGMLGCGGIGLEIVTSLSLMQYQQLSALLLVMLACVTAVDALSNLLRRQTR
jgi:phosphonate transport system permease protein